MDVTGYRHPLYARSLAEFGVPLELPLSGGWLMERHIAEREDVDAVGPYPLFSCQNWGGLPDDLRDVAGHCLTVSIVPDPFGDFTELDLKDIFDVVKPFKEHYVIDLSRPGAFGSPRHRNYARQGAKRITVVVSEKPWDHLDEWLQLYGGLIARKNLSGLRAFSRFAFESQLRVPGMVMFRCLHEDRTIGIDLWYITDEVAYFHLAAYDELGYQMRASYVCKAQAIEFFKGAVGWLNLGGSAGSGPIRHDDGLAQFKRGWATETRLVYFCGRINDRRRYYEVCRNTQTEGSDYFPAYRRGSID